ncbi:MAG: alpha-ketoglutarate-dependent dioxygenase AlkB [Gemmatimonadaceae bacterium]
MSQDQLALFEKARTTYPEGFKYRPNVLTVEQERGLLEKISDLPFKEFDFHGFTGKRRTVSFGWKYSFSDAKLYQSDDIPNFLLKVRETAAEFAGMRPTDLHQVLVSEYRPGAPIGWHRDKSVFGDIIGISLLSSCTFRLRRKTRTGWERVSLIAEPRSAYLLKGPVRSEWEHSIPPVDELRYSITYRSLR